MFLDSSFVILLLIMVFFLIEKIDCGCVVLCGWVLNLIVVFLIDVKIFLLEVIIC